jgi:hypothetical protein
VINAGHTEGEHMLALLRMLDLFDRPAVCRPCGMSLRS